MGAQAQAAGTPELDPRRLRRAARGSSLTWPALVFILCLAFYLAATGLPASPLSELRSDEAHILLSTESLVSDGDLNLTNNYEARDWLLFDGPVLSPRADVIEGRLLEPQGIGFPALVAPAYALAGVRGVEVFLAVIAALGMAAAVSIARRLAPDPWASGAVLAVGLSPPAVVAATTISPAATIAALLAGAAALALRCRESVTRAAPLGAGLLLALVPWIGPVGLLPGAVVAVALFRWLRRRRRGWAGLVALELILVSLVFYVTVNGRLFGGVTPLAASNEPGGPLGADRASEFVARLPRAIGLWLSPEVGILLFAPVLVLAFVSVWLFWHSRRERLARALPEAIDMEVATGFLALVCAAAVLTAILLVPWFSERAPGEALATVLPVAGALCAWGMRRLPVLGIVLAAVGIALSLWLLVTGHLGAGAGISPPVGPLPWSLFG
jgi:hypothetical protein